jgi:hypothetical protein
VRFALQRGREHTELGAIDIVAEEGAAIAISIGGAKKRYAHVDPNEDAALLARARIGTAPLKETRALLVVTDGLTERGMGVDDPEGAVREAVAAAACAPAARRPLVAARGLLERAVASHRRRNAGDNTACAVVWL